MSGRPSDRRRVALGLRTVGVARPITGDGVANRQPVAAVGYVPRRL